MDSSCRSISMGFPASPSLSFDIQVKTAILPDSVNQETRLQYAHGAGPLPDPDQKEGLFGQR